MTETPLETTADNSVGTPAVTPAVTPADARADGPATAGDEPPSRRRVPRWAAAVAALLVLAAVAGAVWTGVRVQHERADQDADAAALAAGRDAATAFTTYDYQHLDRDLGRVSDLSTGTFRDQFTAALGALTQSIRTARGVSVGTVTDAGLVSRTGDGAVVIAAVDASITNSSSPQPATRRYRLQITLDRQSGRWLISDIAPVA